MNSGIAAASAEVACFVDDALTALPSPHFVVDLGVLTTAYEAFQAALPDIGVFYALKANSDPAILTTLARAGSGFEAASWPEIELLLAHGISADRIVYGTAVKPRSHVERAVAAGVDHFAADSREELTMLAESAPGACVFVRAKLDDQRSVFHLNTKFGASIEAVADLLSYATSLGLRAWGLSFNVGSQATLPTEWATGVIAVAPIVEQLLARGIRLDVLNLGGGFPAAYRDHQDIPLTEIAGHIERAANLLPYRPKLVVEPGRRLVASAVSLVATIQARIQRTEGPWLFLDCGVYNALYEALLHQGRTAYPVAALRPQSLGAGSQSFVLAGPTGDGLDVIARDVALPADLGVGDRLLFQNVGAYTRVMASSFNGFPVPPVHYTGA